jgi:hypothetical protein
LPHDAADILLAEAASALAHKISQRATLTELKHDPDLIGEEVNAETAEDVGMAARTHDLYFLFDGLQVAPLPL